MPEGKGRHERLPLALVLISFGQKNPDTEDPPDGVAKLIRFLKVIILRHEDFGQSFWARNQQPSWLNRPRYLMSPWFGIELILNRVSRLPQEKKLGKLGSHRREMPHQSCIGLPDGSLAILAY